MEATQIRSFNNNLGLQAMMTAAAAWLNQKN
jgi:hypothetical protein